MLFPSDAATRRHYVLNEAIKWFQSEEDAGTKPLLRDEVLFPANDQEALPRLLGHEEATRRLGSKITKAYDRGCVAGQMAVIMWLSAHDSAMENNDRIRTSKPSVRKAKDAIVSTYKEQRLTRNRDYVDKAWQSHKSVAHLWARLVLASSEQTLAEDNPETAFNFFLRPYLGEFIVLSEEILHFLRERKNTIKAPWLAPAHLKLPSSEELIRDTLPLSPELSEALRRYKADAYRR